MQNCKINVIFAKKISFDAVIVVDFLRKMDESLW